MLIGLFSLLYLSIVGVHPSQLSLATYMSLFILVLGGIFGSIGSSFMDIAIANDLVPASIKKEKLVRH